MKIDKYPALLFIVFQITACSTSNWYQGMKSRSQLECRKQPAAEYEDCMQGTEKSFNEYEKVREEVEIK